MKNINKSVTIIFIAILIAGCQDEKKYEKAIAISIDIERVNKESVKEWFDFIELIPLATTEASLIKEVFKMIKYNGSYYVYDGWQHIAFEFDSIGNFINSTKTLQGNGPDEFISFLDFDIDPTNGNWHILDHVSSKIRIYNKKMSAIDSYNIDKSVFPLQYFKYLKDSHYAFYCSSAKKGDYVLNIYDSKNGKIIRKELPVAVEKADYLPNVLFSPFYEYDGRIFFTQKYPNNDVFNIDITNFCTEKSLQYDFKEHTFNLKEIEDIDTNDRNDYIKYMDDSDKGFIFNKCENEQYCFISVYYNHCIYIIKHDKITGENKAVVNDYSKRGSLGRPIYLDNDYYYTIVDPENINILVDDTLLTDQAKMVLSKMKDDDNPLIIKYKLKK